MNSTKLASIGLAAALTAILPVIPAQAQVNRTFVSAAGSDSNNCANVLTPCRHLATAYAATAPSGEIFVLDPANYGSLTITHGVSIEGHGWASIAPPNGGNAITINAGPGDSISIHGVSIDGTGATGGTNGIVFNSGGSLTVADCVMQNFVNGGANTGNGILIRPSSGTLNITMTNTTVTNNGFAGIYYISPSGGSPNANGVIDHVVATNNAYGIVADTGAASGGSTVIAISNSTASANSSVGISVNAASAPLKVLLGSSVVTGNGFGIINNTPNTFYTYQNNEIDLNGTDISSPLNTTKPLR